MIAEEITCIVCNKPFVSGRNHKGKRNVCMDCGGKDVPRDRAIVDAGQIITVTDHDTAKRANRKNQRHGAGVSRAMNKKKADKHE